jgi:hypothetical protein
MLGGDVRLVNAVMRILRRCDQLTVQLLGWKRESQREGKEMLGVNAQ